MRQPCPSVSVLCAFILQRVHKTLQVLFARYLLEGKSSAGLCPARVLAWPAVAIDDACALSWGLLLQALYTTQPCWLH